MSGVFSIASHSTLQYLLAVVMHEQTGCAHFSVFVSVISFLLNRSIKDDPPNKVVAEDEHFCTKRNIFQIGSLSERAMFSTEKTQWKRESRYDSRDCQEVEDSPADGT